MIGIKLTVLSGFPFFLSPAPLSRGHYEFYKVNKGRYLFDN